MESQTEKIIKITLFFIIMLALLLYWMLPKTRLARYLKMNETLFIVTNVIGTICGVIGLIVTFIWPQFIVEMHLWELIITPFALIEIYWLMIVRIRKQTAIIDEKQEYNMSRAAAYTMVLSIPAMVIMFWFYNSHIFQGSTWFPYYFFVTILGFSGITLLLFKRY